MPIDRPANKRRQYELVDLARLPKDKPTYIIAPFAAIIVQRFIYILMCSLIDKNNLDHLLNEQSAIMIGEEMKINN